MTVIRWILLAMGLVFTVLLLAFGLVLALLMVGLNLLRGRRPSFQFQVKRPVPGWPGFQRGASKVQPDDVVDVEAREIPDEERKLPR